MPLLPGGQPDDRRTKVNESLTALKSLTTLDKAAIGTHVAEAMLRWKGHILAPSSRKADRLATFQAILGDVVFAACGQDEEAAKRVVNGWH